MSRPSTDNPLPGLLGPNRGHIRREITAGVTTFLTMAYIVVVNPAILSQSGMPTEEVFFATCMAAAIATAVMALWARYPFALAPGMGLNAFFAFTVCGQMDLHWSAGLLAVLISGVVFLVLSLLGLRERLIAAVPPVLVRAIAAGIGLFIAFIGFKQAGIVVDHPETLVTMGQLTAPPTLVALAGLGITVICVSIGLPGAVLVGIGTTAVLAIGIGISPPPTAWIQLPAIPQQTFGAALSALEHLGRPELLVAIFTMLFLDLFDTMGTLLALGYTTGQVSRTGSLPRASRAFTADAIGTIVGALLGTSTVTTYIESAAGVVAGGRHGLTALVTAALFLLTLPFFPLIAAVPAVATAPALIAVGAMVFSSAAEIQWKDPVVAIPALSTILIMPATFNISNGLGAGFVLFTLSHVAARRFGQLNPAVWLVSGAFIVYFALRVGG